MKKSIISTAVLSAIISANLIALETANAESKTTLYGSVRLAIEYNSTGGIGSDGKKNDSGTLSVVNAKSSRFGIKGYEDIGNGLSAIYTYEFGVNADVGGLKSNDRLSYVGLKGDFGTFAIGKQWSPFYNMVGNYNDIWNHRTNPLYLGSYRVANAITYSSPKIGGLTTSIALVANGTERTSILGSRSESSYIDAYNIGARWSESGFTIGASYLQTNGTNDVQQAKLLGLLAGYKSDNFKIGFIFMDKMKPMQKGSDNERHTDKDIYEYDLQAEYKLDKSNILRIGTTIQDSKVEDIDTLEHFQFGYQHNFSKRTRVWAEYAYTDKGSNVDNNSLVSIGLRTDF